MNEASSPDSGNRWRRLTSGSANRRILGATIIVAVATMVVRVAMVARELVTAWKFGAGDQVDMFLIALLVPAFVVNLVAGSFNVALIPTYIRVREQEGDEAAQKLLASVTVWSLLLLAGATILVAFAAPLYLPLVAGKFSPPKLELTLQLLAIIAPIVLLKGVGVVWGAVLNAAEDFGRAALCPLLTPVVTITLLLLTSWGVFALAVGTLVGALLEMMVLGWSLHARGVGLRPRWTGMDEHLRQVVKQILPTLAGSFLMGSTVLVDQAMAAMLARGSVAALNYGNIVVAFPILLAVTALGTAVTPFFSRMAVREDWAGLHYTLRRYLRSIFLVTIPLTALLVFGSHPIVRLLFQRGTFSASDTDTVAGVQALAALQMPFYIAGVFVVRLISSLRANYILMWASALNLAVNITFNFLFMRWLGVKGIALSTSLVYLVSFSFCWLLLQRELKKHAEITSDT